MTSLKTLIVLFFFGVVTNISAQTFAVDSKPDLERDKLSLFNSGVYEIPRVNNTLPKNNQVYLTQVGEFNTININTQTNSSDIKVRQNGSNNDLSFEYIADHAIAKVIQNGSNNKVVDYVNLPGETINLNLTQDGSNLTFDKYGSSTLSESLQFKQTGFSKTLIVRSFK
ncbi:hypothetical protein [Leeuwenhoekiella sp. UBA6783]|uniref:hypothetical protein n=1 Tax=Leeuwenhoekiella sp. UBA6783 TaxID=1946747 RepID=UPI0025BAC308|nr:hypothetical protein [Leeuwenhoekiella sp. UBA6783]|tara:strand:- start:1149 stop:1655 length:507 start_codon:yes stop_codon:yes gene_type:complete